MPVQDFDDFDAPLNGGAKRPIVKFVNPGDKFVGVLVDIDDKYPDFEYGSNGKRRTRTLPDGIVKELTQDLLTVLLMPSTTAPVADLDSDGYLTNVDGVVARVYVKGHNRWTPKPRPETTYPAWRNATDAAGNDYRRGCVVMGVFEATTDVGSDGRKLTQDKKLIGFAVRAAKPEEAPLVARARDEYRAIKAGRAAATEQPRTPDYVRTGAPVPAADEF